MEEYVAIKGLFIDVPYSSNGKFMVHLWTVATIKEAIVCGRIL